MVKTLAIFGMATALLITATHVSAESIRLLPQATVEPHQDVHLGDIATVSGSDPRKAETLANTVILSAPDHAQMIRAEAVLLALAAQRGASAIAGDLQISGAAECEISVGTAAQKPQAAIGSAHQDLTIGATPAQAMSTLDLGSSRPSPLPPQADVRAAQPQAKTSVEFPTLGQLISTRVEQDLGLTTKDVDVHIETISPLIDAAVAPGRKWLCRPLGRALWGTVQFECQLVEGTRTVEKLNVQTTIKHRQVVVIATSVLHRGDVVSKDQVKLAEEWADRKINTRFTIEKDIIGLEAQRDVDVGVPLDQRDFKPALMAHQNEQVTVIYTTGPLQVEIRGRAMEDGKLHDRIRIRNEASGEIYSATLIARGIASAGGMLTEEQEKKIREAP